MTALDPIKYEIFFNRMTEIMTEGKEVLRYLSGSTITREAGEVVVGFYRPDGEAVILASGILAHILNVTQVIRYMNENNYAKFYLKWQGQSIIVICIRRDVTIFDQYSKLLKLAR